MIKITDTIINSAVRIINNSNNNKESPTYIYLILNFYRNLSNMEAEVLRILINSRVDSSTIINFILKDIETKDIQCKIKKSMKKNFKIMRDSNT